MLAVVIHSGFIIGAIAVLATPIMVFAICIWAGKRILEVRDDDSGW